MPGKEAQLQDKVIAHLKRKGCVVMKMPAGYQSIPVGFPDLLALIPGGGFACLEIKATPTSKFQPLQKTWIKKLDEMYFSRAVDPANWDAIKKELDLII